MKKMTRRFWAIIMAIAMVVTSITFTGKDVNAATLSADETTSIAGNGPMTNLAKGVTAEVYPGCAEGSIANLTNGSFGGHCALSSGWGYSGDAYAVIDLGNYYKASSLDEIVLAYKDNATNDTVVSRTYNIQYSEDKTEWRTVYTSDTIAAADLADSNATVNNVSAYTGTVRFIKIDYPSLPTYGIQLTEIAILATNPQIAEIELPDNAADVTTTSEVIGQLTYTIQAGNNQDGYVYDVYLGATLLRANASAGVAYTDDGLPEGDNTIKVVSKNNGLESPGLTKNIHVESHTDYITGEENVAYQKTYTLDSGNSAEGNGSLTDGTISTNSFVTPTKGKAGSWAQIDLGAVYAGAGIDDVTVWFRSNTGGTYPGSGGLKLQYSSDGISYNDVVSLTQAEFTALKKTDAPFGISIDLSEVKADAPDVRYVRIYYPNSVGYGAQMTEIGIFDFDGDLELSDGVVINPPADFTAVGGTDIITGTITADEGQEDYKYDILVDDTKVLTDLSAGDYVINDVVGGTHSVSVVSKYNKKYSTAITINDVEVTAGSVYESGALIQEVFPDTDLVYGNNYVRYAGVSASESSAVNNASTAMAAIDNNLGTRWESEASDPQYMTVDLKNEYEIDQVRIAWEGASAAKYRIEVSSNGRDYTSVASVSNNSGARTDTITFNKEVSARFVRIYGTERHTQYSYSIYEMAIYGPDAEQDAVILTPVKKAYIYNEVDAGLGYRVEFSDPNSITRVEGDQYEYIVTVNGHEYTIDKSGDFIDLSDAGLTVGETYTGTVKVKYTDSIGIEDYTSATTTSRFVYTAQAQAAYATGLPSVHVRTSRTDSNVGLSLFTDETKGKVDSSVIIKTANGAVNVQGVATINVRGNSTKSAQKKAYNIKYTEKLNVLGMGKAKKWCLLANCFDKTLMRNQVAFYFQNQLEQTQSSGHIYSSLVKAVDLYIDGYYVGEYLLTEAVEAGSTRVAIDAENTENTDILLELDDQGRDRASDAHLVKNITYDGEGNVDTFEYYESALKMQFAVNDPGEDGESNMPAFKEWMKTNEAKILRTEAFIDDFEDAIIAKDYTTLCELADMESFVDFYITSEFFKTKDIGFSSTRYYIQGDGEGHNKIYAGPLWDLDLSSGNANNNEKYDDPYARNENKWFRALMEIPEFRDAVAARWSEKLSLVHSIYRNGGIIDQTYDEISASATLNYSVAHNVFSAAENDYNNGWDVTALYGASTVLGENVYGSTIVHDTYEEYVEDFKTWMTNRGAWMSSYLGVDDIAVDELQPLTKAYVFNAVDAGKGYQVTFTDSNEILRKEGDSYRYILTVNGEDIEVEASGKYVSLENIGLVDGQTYTGTIKAVYTSPGGAVVESMPTTTSRFTYTSTPLVSYDTGIASVHVRTSRTTSNANLNLFTDESKTKVDAEMMVIKSDGTVDTAGFGAINVRGNSTKSAQKKAYNFKYDSKQNVLKMGKAKKWCLLANCFDKTLMRNQVAFYFQNQLEKTQSSGNVYSSLVKPVDLYVDGYYLGEYLLTEAVETGSTRVDLNEERADNTDILLEIDDQGRDRASDAHLVKNVQVDSEGNVTSYEYYESALKMQFAVNDPGEDGESNMPAFKEWMKEYGGKCELVEAFIDEFEAAVIDKDYEEICKLADMESFVDFYITSELFKTKDIGFSSTRYYIKDGKLYAGPLWDLDLSSGNANNNEKYDDPYAKNENKWFKALWDVPEFRAAVAKRFEEQLPLIRSLYADGGVIDQTYDEIIDSVTLNYSVAHNVFSSAENDYNNGWDVTALYGASTKLGENVYGSMIVHDTYDEYFNDFKTWMVNRGKWMTKYVGAIDTYDDVYLNNEDGDVVLHWNTTLEDVANFEIQFTEYGNEDPTTITVAGNLTETVLDYALANESTVTVTAIKANDDRIVVGEAEALADLKVMDVTNAPTTMVEGTAITFTMVVKNVGTAVAVPSTDVISSTIRVDDVQIGYTAGYTGPLNPGETVNNYSFSNTWAANIVTAGTHEVKALIDERSHVNEYSEENNTLQKKFVVLKAEGVQDTDYVDVTGFQLSTSMGENHDDVGIRTVYQVEPETASKIVEVGLIYAIEYNNTFPEDEELVYGSTNPLVAKATATKNGILDKKYGDSDTADYYAMTMPSLNLYNQNYKVRVYTIQKDGTVTYSDVSQFNPLDLAKDLYENNKMSTATAHNKLYEIIKSEDADYEQVSYEWNKTLVDTNDSEAAVKIEGFQMSSAFGGVNGAMGLRVVYSTEGTYDETGLIYGIKYGSNPIDETYMTMDYANVNTYVKSYAATELGVLDARMNTSTTANYYARTMQISAGKTKAYYTTEYMVRAYVRQGDEIIYSDVATYSYESVAAALYEGIMMSSYNGHICLYENILSKLEGYVPVDYKWENNLVVD